MPATGILNAARHDGATLIANKEAERAIPHGPTGYSSSDNSARMQEIVKNNKLNGVPNALDVFGGLKYFTNFSVCYSITEEKTDQGKTKGKCDPTGEIVRVPGDLAEPPSFWTSYGNKCYKAGFSGLEVALSSPSVADHRKRYMSCTELMLLGARRAQLIELGIK